MKWDQILSTKRSRQIKGARASQADLRSEFEKDYHRIIGSASFRRLQDKTQVFPLDQSDFVRTRLTHSLEVASYAKSLGQNIGESILTYGRDRSFTPRMKQEISSILECAGLIHDIGNPPFGHFGEGSIREWFRRNLPGLSYKGQPVTDLLTGQMVGDFYHFEGNAQALRLVSRLHYLVDEHGMNLTYALLNTIVKYPVSSIHIDKHTGNIKDKKMGYYYADEAFYHDIAKENGTEGKRHPLTFILEAADDIAYKTADIEDAFVKGFLPYRQICSELEKLPKPETEKEREHGFDALKRLREKYESGRRRGVQNPEEYAVKNWIVRMQGFLISCATYGFMSHYEEIMEGTYGSDLFAGTYGEKLMDLLGDVAYRHVFSTPQIYKLEIAESVMLDFLMDKFVHAVLYYDTDKRLSDIDERIISLISGNYKTAYHCQAEGKSEGEKLYLRFLLVTDYICGMTDSYAKRLYQELNAIV